MGAFVGQSEIPAAFDLARYDGVERFTAADWLGNLEARAPLINLAAGAYSHQMAEAMLLHPLRPPYRPRGGFDVPRYVGQPVAPGDACALPSWVSVGVDLLAPADALKRQFANWLRATRKEKKLPVINRHFSREDFATWHARRVLPFLDLTFWAWCRGQRVPNELMGSLLFPDEPDRNVEARVRKSVEPLALALTQSACLQNLRTVCEGE